MELALKARNLTFLLVLVTTSSTSALDWWWQPEWCTIYPRYPSSRDEFSVSLGGYWPDSCIPIGSSVTVQGSEIHIDVVEHPPTGCFTAISPWSIHERVSPLAPGTYTVVATLYQGAEVVGAATPMSKVVVTPTPRVCREVGGLICEDTTWTAADGPYCAIQPVVVACGSTLTIEPGVHVRFPRGVFGLTIGSELHGTGMLIARGAVEAPILFGSDEPFPLPADWLGLEFTAQSAEAAFDEVGAYVGGSILEHVVVEYAGHPNSRGAVVADDSAPYLSRCTMRRNGSAFGVSLRWSSNDGPSARIDNCVVRDNEGIGIDIGRGSRVSLTRNRIERNARHGILVWGCADALVTGNQVADNNGGGVLMNFSSDSVITGNTVTDNAETGIWANASDRLVLDGNTVARNRGHTSRGGIMILDSRHVVLSSTAIVRNAGLFDGAGLFVMVSNDIEINDCVIAGNSSVGGDHGVGGIVVSYSDAVSLRVEDGGLVSVLANTLIDLRNDSEYRSGVFDVDARNVWWGTTDSSEITERVDDCQDDPAKACVFTVPWATTGPFDFSGDGRILIDDVSGLVDALGASDCEVSGEAGCRLGDIDRDGDVDLFDFAVFEPVVRRDPQLR